MLTDAKRDFKVRISAAEALNLAGDPTSLPTLLQVAKTGDVVKDKREVSRRAAGGGDGLRAPRWRGGSGGVRAGGGGGEGGDRGVQGRRRAPRRGQEVRQGRDLLRDGARLPTRACRTRRRRRSCWRAWASRRCRRCSRSCRRASRSCARRCCSASARSPTSRRRRRKKALDAQIDIDRTKPPMRALVEEMRAVRAMISH